jgi:hypothetical protein
MHDVLTTSPLVAAAAAAAATTSDCTLFVATAASLGTIVGYSCTYLASNYPISRYLFEYLSYIRNQIKSLNDIYVRRVLSFIHRSEGET